MPVQIFVAKLEGKCFMCKQELLGKRVAYNRNKQLCHCDCLWPDKAKRSENLKNLNAPTPQMREKAGAFSLDDSQKSPSRVAPAPNASFKTQPSSKGTPNGGEGAGSTRMEPPTPLSLKEIDNIYLEAKLRLSDAGFEVTPDLLSIALKISLERHVELFWLKYTEWEFSLKEANRKAWKGN